MQNTILSVLLFFVVFMAKAQVWKTDLDEAQRIASEKNQHIILVFQGSDWCAPCIKLEKEIWSSETFKNYAKNHFTLLKANFPRKKKNKLDPLIQEKNNKLMETYNKQGFFPFVVILDEKGTVLGETGYKKMGPAEYIELLKSF